MNSLLRLRTIAIVAPLAFAVGLAIFTEEVLTDWTSDTSAHLIATAILTCGVITFTFWVFGVLERLQAELDRHRVRELDYAAEMARLEERERIGVGLHDDVIQIVYGVQLRLEGCLASLPSGSEAAVCVDASIDDLDGVAGKMRQYIFGLCPQLREDGNLDRALRDLLRDVEVNSAARTEYRVESNALSDLNTPDAATLFEIAAHAVGSAVRRKATDVRIGGTVDDTSVWLELSDNGSPFVAEDEECFRQAQCTLATASQVNGWNTVRAAVKRTSQGSA